MAGEGNVANPEHRTNAFETAYWELIQVLAWVFLRDRELVERLADPGFRQQQYYWAEVVLPDGRRTDARQNAGPVNDLTLDITASYEELYEDQLPCFKNSQGAIDAIIREMANGNLVGWGFENDRGNLTEIPQIQMTELKIHFYRHPVISPEVTFSEASSWHRVKFRSADVLRIWPPQTTMRVSEMIDTVPEGFQSLRSVYQKVREATRQDERVRVFREQVQDGPGDEVPGENGGRALTDLWQGEDGLRDSFRDFLATGKVGVWMRGPEEIPASYWEDTFCGDLAIAHGTYQVSSSKNFSGPKEEDPIRHRGKQLLFKREDLEIVFGTFDADGGSEEPQYRTGTEGRPTSWHLVRAECERRVAAGESEFKATKEAEELLKWVKDKHPKAPLLTQKTIYNRLTSDSYFMKLRASFEPNGKIPK
jgi:hypothetical protein